MISLYLFQVPYEQIVAFLNHKIHTIHFIETLICL